MPALQLKEFPRRSTARGKPSVKYIRKVRSTRRTMSKCLKGTCSQRLGLSVHKSENFAAANRNVGFGKFKARSHYDKLLNVFPSMEADQRLAFLSGH